MGAQVATRMGLALRLCTPPGHVLCSWPRPRPSSQLPLHTRRPWSMRAPQEALPSAISSPSLLRLPMLTPHHSFNYKPCFLPNRYLHLPYTPTPSPPPPTHRRHRAHAPTRGPGRPLLLRGPPVCQPQPALRAHPGHRRGHGGAAPGEGGAGGGWGGCGVRGAGAGAGACVWCWWLETAGPCRPKQ